MQVSHFITLSVDRTRVPGPEINRIMARAVTAVHRFNQGGPEAERVAVAPLDMMTGNAERPPVIGSRLRFFGTEGVMGAFGADTELRFLRQLENMGDVSLTGIRELPASAPMVVYHRRKGTNTLGGSRARRLAKRRKERNEPIREEELHAAHAAARAAVEAAQEAPGRVVQPFLLMSSVSRQTEFPIEVLERVVPQDHSQHILAGMVPNGVVDKDHRNVPVIYGVDTYGFSTAERRCPLPKFR